MDDLIDKCVEKLRLLGVDLRAGLSHSEIAGIEGEFGFTFSTDHAALLTAVLPVGDAWVDWRQSDRDDLRSRLEWPTDGVLFDVELNSFWPASWGPRPDDIISALAVARVRMDAVPTLVPIHSHRYLPAAPAPHLTPVFSVYQTDVIYYGADLLDYIDHEFDQTEWPWVPRRYGPRIGFWSDLAEGADSASL
jgi:hypothetical protein